MYIAVCTAFEPFLFEEGHKFLENLRDADHRCYVLLFKNSNAGGRKVDQSELNDRNNKQQKALEDKVKGEPNVTYAVVDIGDPNLNQDTQRDLDEFFKESRIDPKDLDSYPITAVMDDGVGAYVWGPKHELVITRVIEAFRHGRLGNPNN